jgi:hypothetical protein
LDVFALQMSRIPAPDRSAAPGELGSLLPDFTATAAAVVARRDEALDRDQS